MRNHIHLVLETTERGGSMAEIMKGINPVFQRQIQAHRAFLARQI
ncbi:MAG: hypothetical protein HY035_01375 [Nitrospirae bacterium]|nr:hypothetical protein [Nitrospirota bacterium]